MTAIAEDLDLSVLEQILEDEDIPCDFSNEDNTPCARPAMWVGVMKPCGHDCKACNFHRLKELSIIKSGIGVWCSISNVEITDIEFTPLG